MSTRWNNGLKLQKTPKVCKKVPPPPDPATTSFHTFPLQAYALWSDSQTPLEQVISGTTNLTAHQSTFTHTGTIRGGRASLDLLLQWNVLTSDFTYTVSLYILGVFEKSVSVTFADPTALLPFAAGLFVWNPPGLPECVESKIYS